MTNGNIINMNFFHDEPFTLSKLRNILIRLEDTIIYNLIERSQFKHNLVCYEPGKFSFKNDYKDSFMMYMLHETESLHSKVRRFTSPDEYNFTEPLEEPILSGLNYPKIFHTKYLETFNINTKVMKVYLKDILAHICKEGDDSNYGSSVVCDTECLLSMSKRIHYGKFIAEAKFCNAATQQTYIDLIENQDADGIMKLLTNEEVEKRLLERVRRKAMLYGSELITDTVTPDQIIAVDGKNSTVDAFKVDPQFVVDIYENYIMPMTKEVQVEYLLHRLDPCEDLDAEHSEKIPSTPSQEYFKDFVKQ